MSALAFIAFPACTPSVVCTVDLDCVVGTVCVLGECISEGIGIMTQVDEGYGIDGARDISGNGPPETD
jgi:hypothetical protein